MISTSNPTKAANAARITGGQNIGPKTPAMRHTDSSGTTPTRNFNAINGSDFNFVGAPAPGSAATVPAGRDRFSIR
jgi:hypothetical protein